MLKTRAKRNKNIELTGNPFVDTGLATIPALSNCKNIDELTLRKMKNVRGDETELARSNLRLRTTSRIFPDSLLTNPAFKDKAKTAKNYAKITTAFLYNIGNEDNEEMCETCGNSSSVELDKSSILIRLPSLVRMVGMVGMVCSKVSEHIAS